MDKEECTSKVLEFGIEMFELARRKAGKRRWRVPAKKSNGRVTTDLAGLALGSTKLNESQLVFFWVLNRFEILSIQNEALHQAAVEVSSVGERT